MCIQTIRHAFSLLPLLLTIASLSTAREAWHFLPTFGHDIRGIEARPAKDKSFAETIPAPTQKLLKPDSGLTEKQRKEIHWHPATFPHQDFVRLMPERRVFGWYGCQFDVPEALAGMDVLVDLGIIDDSDETFVNGRLVGKTGKVPDGSAWQADRLYRVPAELLEGKGNYLAVHVWSLWGLGGIVGPPVLKAALASADTPWDVAFAKDSAKPVSGLNVVATAKDALSIIGNGRPLELQKRSMPWTGYADLPDDVHYTIFKLQFELKNSDGSPRRFPKPVVLDVGAVFDVAAFFLNGRRLGLVGRFPEGGEPSFTEAAQRAQMIVPPDAWSADGHNELVAVVYRERGVGGLPGVPGILLSSPLDSQPQVFEDISNAFLIQLQSGNLAQAEAVLTNAKTMTTDTERVWLLSHQAHLAFLKWHDGGRKDNRLLDGVLAPIAEIFAKYPAESPKQSAMQAFCRILRLAEWDSAIEPIVRKRFPSFSTDCIVMASDRTTKGDWMLHYGEFFHALAAMGQTADWIGGRGECKYRLYVPGKKDVPRYWLPNSQRKLSNPSAFIMYFPLTEMAGKLKTIGIKDVMPSLFPQMSIRRASWWDDHGEMHSFDDEGPDMTLQMSSLPEECQVSLYFLDYDWKSTLHPRQQSMVVFDDSRNIINAVWSGKTDNGVYERLSIAGKKSISLRFSKHRGACVAVSGFFIDRCPVLPVLPEKLPGTVNGEIVNLYESLRQATGTEKTRIARHIMDEWRRHPNAEGSLKGLFILAAALECAGMDYEWLFFIQESLRKLHAYKEMMDWLEEIKSIRNVSPVWHYIVAACLFERLPIVSPEEADEYPYRLFMMCDNRFLLPIRRVCLNALATSTKKEAMERIELMRSLLPERYRDKNKE